MKKLYLSLILSLGCFFSALPQSVINLDGSRKPYPLQTEIASVPDSLTVVMINHVGRHGARYPTDSMPFIRLRNLLFEAENMRSLPQNGAHLQAIVENALNVIDGRWGQLDELGIKEQESIARKMYKSFPDAFRHGNVEAISSYIPRCIDSMHSFIHGLVAENDSLSISTSSGHQYDYLLRPFAIDDTFLQYRKEAPYSKTLEEFSKKHLPINRVDRILGKKMKLSNDEKSQCLKDIYYVLSSLPACGITNADPLTILDYATFKALWENDNLRQYFIRSANYFSMVPAEIAKPLLRELISTTDKYLYSGEGAAVQLRFGHAETLYPLVALMELQDCFYITTEYETLYEHWASWYIAPMAANLQMIILKSTTGKYYLRVDYNNQTMVLAPGQPPYLPWLQSKAILESTF